MVDETATGSPMQDIAARLESVLDADDGQNPGEEIKGEEVIEDVDLPDEDDQLPDDDDPDPKEEAQDDLDDIASEDDLSLADYLGVEDDRISIDEETGAVQLVAKIDGEESLVPLSELVTSYQLQGHVNNKSISLENERKEFEEVRNEAASKLTSRFDETESLQKALENEVVSEYNAIDWDALRLQDPANWTALRQEFAEKAQRIQQAGNIIKQQRDEISQQQQVQMQQAFGKHVAEQRSKVIEKHPDWADDAKFKEGMVAINTFLKDTYQFGDEELKALNDHRLLSVIEDAKAFRDGKQGAESKRKKDLPKFIKPGASRKNSASLAKARAVKAKRQAVRDSGSVQSVASLLEDRM